MQGMAVHEVGVPLSRSPAHHRHALRGSGRTGAVSGSRLLPVLKADGGDFILLFTFTAIGKQPDTYTY